MLPYLTQRSNKTILVDLSKKVLLLSTGSINDGVSAPGKATSSSTISSDSIMHRLSRPTTLLSRGKYVGGSYSHRGLSLRPLSSIEYQYDYDDDVDEEEEEEEEEEEGNGVESSLLDFEQVLMNLAKQAYTNIGPNKKEKPYHDQLYRLLCDNGYDVRYKVSLTYRHQGTIKAREVDLTVSIRGRSKDILIECKALKKIEKGGIKQILDYQKLSGSDVCFLLNFSRDPKNDFEEDNIVVKGRFWDDADSLYDPRIIALSIFPEAKLKGN
jgi:GxxExxY protein